MNATLIFLFLALSGGAYSQVGIGTANPSTNAALDVSSTDKGLMLPRLNDTANVTNPSAGLMIYDRQTSAPAFHDGNKWNTLASRTAAAGEDSVTYTITSPGTGYTGGVYTSPLSLGQAISNTYSYSGSIYMSGRAAFQDLIMTKELDANSVSFIRAVTTGYYSSTMVIEFKVFTPGAANPNYSIKLTGPYITSTNVSIAEGGKYIERVSMNGIIYGYKNWITGATFAWNVPLNASATY